MGFRGTRTGSAGGVGPTVEAGEITAMSIAELNTILSDGDVDDLNEKRPSLTGTDQERFVATAGQTEFTLATVLAGAEFSAFFVNGIEYPITVHYTISGTTLTWLETDFQLEAGDVITVFCEIE